MKALTCKFVPVHRPSQKGSSADSEEVLMPSPRRLFRLLPSVLVLLATVALLLVGCGGDGDEATDADAAGTGGGSESAEPVTLSVGLFGTFGYEEAGLYD